MVFLDKALKGMLLGAVAGVVDVIPMLAQNLSWDADLSAFSMWVVAGFMISTSGLRLPGVLKGALVSFLLLLPCAVLIAWKEPASLVPVAAMTLVLGSLLGHFIGRIPPG
ncbi:MAG: hypothetical protein PHF51_03715 [Candidatus ainarchaeum sp.]|nr:hypothetical protein [Candidatus ainarchaeum sp.]